MYYAYGYVHVCFSNNCHRLVIIMQLEVWILDHHWNLAVFMSNSLSNVVLKVVITTTSSATSDGKIGIMTTVDFQWFCWKGYSMSQWYMLYVFVHA